MGLSVSCDPRHADGVPESSGGIASRSRSRANDIDCGCPRASHNGIFCGMGAKSSGFRESLVPEPAKPRHLVFNMDVNKTILMLDSVTGKKAVDVVNETLANAAWGEVVDGKWVLRCSKPSVCRPALDGDRSMDLISYAEWVNKQYPGSENKKARMNLNGSFTEKGHPGEKMKTLAKTMLSALTWPDGSETRILPSFFELLLWAKREKRSFSLCFRTFGEDLPEIAAELNSFCEGRHPQYPDVRMDGSDGGPDYRFDATCIQQVGTFHRDKNTLSLIMGTTDQAGEGRHKDVKDKSLQFYRSMQGVRIFSGFDVVKEKLETMTGRCGTYGLRDYFAYWKEKKMTSDGGKVFLYNPTRETCRHELFFDDNIHFSDCHIVQPIDVCAPERKHWVVPLLQTHLCRAEPLESVPDRQWFVKQVQRLEKGYEIKLCARERLLALLWKVVKLKRQGRVFPVFEENTVASFDAWAALRRGDNELSLCEEEGEAY